MKTRHVDIMTENRLRIGLEPRE